MRGKLRLALAVLVCAGMFVVGEQARAEDEARAIYLEGHAAAAQGRWSVALERFREAYRLSRNAAALFNVGAALRGLGHHREARDTFVHFLRDHGDADEELLAKAAQLRDEEAAHVVVLVVDGLSGCDVRLDGRAMPFAGGHHEIETDPGEHALIGECPGHAVREWSGVLEHGERRRLTLAPGPTIAPAPALQAPRQSDTPRPSPPVWPWVLIGAGGTVLVAGAVMLGVGVADRNSVENAADGSDWPSVEGAYERSQVFAWLGPALMGAGAAAIVGGIVGSVTQDGATAAWIAPAGVRVRF